MSYLTLKNIQHLTTTKFEATIFSFTLYFFLDFHLFAPGLPVPVDPGGWCAKLKTITKKQRQCMIQGSGCTLPALQTMDYKTGKSFNMKYKQSNKS